MDIIKAVLLVAVVIAPSVLLYVATKDAGK